MLVAVVVVSQDLMKLNWASQQVQDKLLAVRVNLPAACCDCLVVVGNAMRKGILLGNLLGEKRLVNLARLLELPQILQSARRLFLRGLILNAWRVRSLKLKSLRQVTERCVAVVSPIRKMLVGGPVEVDALQQTLELITLILDWRDILGECQI